MLRARKMREIRRRQAMRNRRIAAVCLAVMISLSLSILFHKSGVQAERPKTYKYYTDVRVERGQTLWDIAMEYMTEEYKSPKEYIKEVQEINDIGMSIEYGQYLVVPYYSEEIK